MSISRVVGDGSNTSFWFDRWHGNGSCALYCSFPNLFRIISNPNITVADVFTNFPSSFQFNRQLTGIIFSEWLQLLGLFSSYSLDSSCPDRILWSWNSSGLFTVNSLYKWLSFRGVPTSIYNTLWKAKIPLKIKVFVWLLRHDKILTKCNLQSRGWHGTVDCVFCGAPETVDHLFVTCPFISSLWSWIGNHNNFLFNCTKVCDLWYFDYWIPLKDSLLVELIRDATLLIVWLTQEI